MQAETGFTNSSVHGKSADGLPEKKRHDPYGAIHKGLRSFMQDTLFHVGSMDVGDPSSTSAALARTRALLTMCRNHLEHENRLVHPAIEARLPGGAARTRMEHEGHERSIALLETRVHDLEHAAAEGEISLAERLAKAFYLELSRFVAENLEHMHVEETENTRHLWALYSDDELRQIQGAIIASETPEQIAQSFRWMLPALSPSERAGLLSGARAGMPAEAFQGVLALARSVLAPRDWEKLVAALGITSGRN